MKKRCLSVAALCAAAAMLLCGCDPVDLLYGVNSEADTSAAQTVSSQREKGYKYPTIMSDDRVISTYIDISKYDEENYAQIYLGKRFAIAAEYAGAELPVPSSFSELAEKGWALTPDSKYNESSTVFPFETVKTEFINGDGKLLTAYFYNAKKTSLTLAQCSAVRLKVEGNGLFEEGSPYADFHVNGVMNSSAVTDVIDALGSPSHFYAVDEENYYLDYFLTQKDRRNGITVYINIPEDCVTAIEWAYYK